MSFKHRNSFSMSRSYSTNLRIQKDCIKEKLSDSMGNKILTLTRKEKRIRTSKFADKGKNKYKKSNNKFKSKRS